MSNSGDGIIISPIVTNTNVDAKHTTLVEERRRLLRAVKCSLLLMLFWLLILWLLYEHDNKLVIALISLFSLVVLSLAGAVCYLLLVPPTKSASTYGDDANDEEYELTEQEAQKSTLVKTSSSNNKDGNNNNHTSAEGVFSFSFDQTPHRIRQCNDYAVSSDAPQDGTYKIVYTAIVFGKQIRSEGYLQLAFVPNSSSTNPLLNNNTGWEIHGTSLFGKGHRQASIQEGFVNAKGHIYWVLTQQLTSSTTVGNNINDNDNDNKKINSSNRELRNVTVYRGKWHLTNRVWEDGDFQSILSSSEEVNATGAGRHEGRIVRMELQSPSTSTDRGDNKRNQLYNGDGSVVKVLGSKLV